MGNNSSAACGSPASILSRSPETSLIEVRPVDLKSFSANRGKEEVDSSHYILDASDCQHPRPTGIGACRHSIRVRARTVDVCTRGFGVPVPVRLATQQR